MRGKKKKKKRLKLLEESERMGMRREQPRRGREVRLQQDPAKKGSRTEAHQVLGQRGCGRRADYGAVGWCPIKLGVFRPRLWAVGLQSQVKHVNLGCFS